MHFPEPQNRSWPRRHPRAPSENLPGPAVHPRPSSAPVDRPAARNHLKGKWALVLGASSGFGEAVCREAARRGMNILGVHLDRKPALPRIERLQAELRSAGGEIAFFNVNAADEARRADVVEAAARALDGGAVHLFLHSLAFGALRPFAIGETRITRPQMEMTLDVMAHSLVYWTQDLRTRGLLRRGSRIFAMTSAGGRRVWPAYGAVSAAKAALESHVRQLAFELAPEGIAVNAVRAGVTDTPSLRKVPGHDEMIARARDHNPAGRLTTPEDVAGALIALVQPGTEWITGNVIGADGGEMLV